MTTLLALLLSIPAFSCGDRPSAPGHGAVSDQARGQRVAAALKTAEAGRETERKRLWAELEAKRDYQDLVKSIEKLDYSSSERLRLDKLRDIRAKREVWAPLDQSHPVDVNHMTYLCGGTTLPCGHSINAGSSWHVKNASLTERNGVDVKGAEMHYLAEHGQATPWLFETLERLLGLPSPPKVQGEKVGATVTRLAAADWN